MKKIITGFAVLLTASVIHAACINWSVTGAASAVAHDVLGNAYSSTAYLVYANDMTMFDELQSKADFFADLESITLSTVDISAGAKPVVSARVIENDLLTTGETATFGLLIVSEDADSKGYINYVSVSGTPYSKGAAAKDQTRAMTPWALDSSSSSGWKQVYPIIPEPATGALALAGLALLFRRKRA